MNNKGFAITTILYGIMILFCLLLVSLLSILSSYRKTQELLIEENNGARAIIGGTVGNVDEEGEPSNSSGSSSSSSPSSNQDTYRVTFICRNGTFSGGKNSFSVVPGTTINLDKYSCKATGIFSGWNTNMNASNGMFGNYTVTDSNVTFYDIWKNLSSSGNLVTE